MIPVPVGIKLPVNSVIKTPMQIEHTTYNVALCQDLEGMGVDFRLKTNVSGICLSQIYQELFNPVYIGNIHPKRMLRISETSTDNPCSSYHVMK